MTRFLLRSVGPIALLACSPTPPELPTYDPDVKAVLEQHCERCHNAGGRRDGGVQLDEFRSARSNRIGIACTAADEGVVAEYAGALGSLRNPEGPDCGFDDAAFAIASMPPGATPHLSRSDQRLLIEWILAGALE